MGKVPQALTPPQRNRCTGSEACGVRLVPHLLSHSNASSIERWIGLICTHRRSAERQGRMRGIPEMVNTCKVNLISFELTAYCVLFSLFSCDRRIDCCCYHVPVDELVIRTNHDSGPSSSALRFHVSVDLVNENVACVPQQRISVAQLRGGFLQI
ncbi:hypothetical protein BGW80DRAFT_761294 [Lactifluus volemus]|nr:hypothetical protein BGW80DRAFT_761294 [Lactifluus volemus]